MRDSGKEYQPSSKDYFVMISNTVLILVTAVFLMTVFSMYRDRMQAISLSESRFLTTEWRLLQKLREQTDRILLEKEQEITELNRRYLNLVRENATHQELRQIESRLQQAQVEREEIMSRRTAVVAGEESDRSTWLRELLPGNSRSSPERLSPADTTQSEPAAEDHSVQLQELLSREGHLSLTELLQNRLKELEGRFEEDLRRIETLESDNMVMRTQLDGEIRKNTNESARYLLKIGMLEDTILRLKVAARTAVSEFGEKSRDLSGRIRPGVEDLAVRALIRAVISSPEIRSVYPDLLSSFDRYLDAYGLQQRFTGRREAYAEAVQAFGPLAGETVQGSAPDN